MLQVNYISNPFQWTLWSVLSAYPWPIEHLCMRVSLFSQCSTLFPQAIPECDAHHWAPPAGSYFVAWLVTCWLKLLKANYDIHWSSIIDFYLLQNAHRGLPDFKWPPHNIFGSLAPLVSVFYLFNSFPFCMIEHLFQVVVVGWSAPLFPQVRLR